MNIKRYEPGDQNPCLEIFDSNQDVYFGQHERALFSEFLQHGTELETYYVIQAGDGVVACGGFILTGPGIVELNWGMVHREQQGKGYGKALLEYRLGLIEKAHPGASVRIDTSQHTAGFFSKYGFQAIEVEMDGFGPGLDKVTMLLHRPI